MLLQALFAIRRRSPAGGMTALIEAQDLACERGDRVLFERVCFAVGNGEVFHIEGANGSGKTTLLRILCGLTSATSGELRWRGRAITPGRRDYHREIQFVGHAAGIKLELTPLENLRFSSALSHPANDADIEQVLGAFGLARVVDLATRRLSAGQRRRVALARLELSRASLWILDEPLTALDSIGIELLNRTLEAHCASGGAVVLASHQPVRLGLRSVRSIKLGGAA